VAAAIAGDAAREVQRINASVKAAEQKVKQEADRLGINPNARENG